MMNTAHDATAPSHDAADGQRIEFQSALVAVTALIELASERTVTSLGRVNIDTDNAPYTSA